MAEKVLTVEERTEKGSSASRRARHEGIIPAVVYGHEAPRHILVNAREFRAVFKHISESEIVTLKLGKEKIQVLVKDYQADMIKGNLIHLDFYEIEAGKTLKTNVALHIVGTPAEVRQGGILEAPLHELEIECLPKDLPESIEVDVSDLDTSSAMHVGDIKAPEGVKILTNEDQLIAAVTFAKEEVEETDEEAEDEAVAETEPETEE